MSSRSGPFVNIRTAATYVANATWYSTTAFQMGPQANTICLYATVAVASAGNIEFYIQHSVDGTTYFDLCSGSESPELFGPITVAGADTRSLVIPGLPPNEYVQIYFRCSAGAGSATLGLNALSYLDDSGSINADVSVGDIEVSLENLELAEDTQHASGDSGIQMLAVRNDTLASLCSTDGDYVPLQVNDVGALFINQAEIVGTAIDVNSGNKSAGSQRVVLASDDVLTSAANALLTTIDADTGAIATDAAAIEVLLTDVPNVIGTDGSGGPSKALSVAGTDGSGNLQELKTDTDGELQVDVLTLPGSLVGHAEDDTHTTADVGIECLAVRADTAATTTDSTGDYHPLLVDGSGRLWAHDPLAEALLTTIDADTSTIAGDTTSLDAKQPALGTATMTGSSPVTIATDDTVLSATNALLTTMDADTGAMVTDLAAIEVLLGTIDTDTGVIAGDTTSLDAKTPALGTATMTGSSPVTIATDDTMTAAANALLGTIDADTGAIKTAVELIDHLVTADRGVSGGGVQRVVEAQDIVVDEATGAAGIAKSTTNSANFVLESVTCHFSAAPTTSENFTITLNANTDPGSQEYDTVLYSIDPSATAAADIVYLPDRPIVFESGDEIDVAFTNTDTRTYGLRIVTRKI